MEKSKSRALRAWSRGIGYGGVGACMITAIIYFLFQQFGGKDVGAFDVNNLYIIAAAAGVFIVVALILRIASNVAKRGEDAIIEEVIEDVIEEAVEEEEIEEEEAVEEEVAAEEEAPAEKRSIREIIREKANLTPEQKEKVVATLKKGAPIAAAVVATVVVTGTLNKLKNEKRKAKIRKNILDLLY